MNTVRYTVHDVDGCCKYNFQYKDDAIVIKIKSPFVERLNRNKVNTEIPI